MVTKRNVRASKCKICLILAKIHMVTKLKGALITIPPSLILAKIHMVTKQQKYEIN